MSHLDHHAAHPAHHHHASAPAASPSLNRLAFSATVHCLTGCAIGEVLGMVIGTALGWGNGATIALAVVLAFLFGYGLTMLPLLRSGLAFGAALGLALAADTASIAIMEVVDNAIMLVIPGAMHAGLGSALFWGSLAVALLIAGRGGLPGQPLAHRPRPGPCRRAWASGGHSCPLRTPRAGSGPVSWACRSTARSPSGRACS